MFDKELWNKSQEILGVRYNTTLRYNWLSENIIGDSVADLGCASGDSIRRWFDEGHKGKFLAIGDQQGLIEEGIKRNSDLPIEWIHLSIGATQPIPKSDSSYDTVIASEMLEHNLVYNVPIIISEAIRIAKYRVLITTPNAEWINTVPDIIISGHTTMFTRSIFQKILDNPEVWNCWYGELRNYDNIETLKHIGWQKISYSIDDSTCYILIKIDKEIKND